MVPTSMWERWPQFNRLREVSADVVAAEQAVVAQLKEELFTDLGNRYPQIFRYIAQELASRLLQRNALVGTLREDI